MPRDTKTKKPPPITSAAQLREARRKTHLTQDEAAHLVHREGHRTWRRWELGERPIDEAIAHLFALRAGLPYPYPPAPEAG